MHLVVFRYMRVITMKNTLVRYNMRMEWAVNLS